MASYSFKVLKILAVSSVRKVKVVQILAARSIVRKVKVVQILAVRKADIIKTLPQN